MEKVVFAFANHLAELEVRKMKRHRSASGEYGKIEWLVTKVNIPGCSLKGGEVLPTRRVFHLARNIDPRAAHAFDMENQPR